MSDRSAASARFYIIPDEAAARVAADVLHEHGFHLEYADETPLGELAEVGVNYWVDELCLGYPEEMAKALETVENEDGEERPSGLAFEISQDPKYEFDGYIVMVDPELGRYDGLANGETNAYVLASQIDSIIDSTDTSIIARYGDDHPPKWTIKELIEKLNDLTGRPWRDKFAAMRKEQES